jgi:nitrite reductase/ring-hydroxylating ferredoxin subunit
MARARVASAEELERAGALEVVVGGRVVALFGGEGGPVAVDGICPHQGGPLARGERRGAELTCPWHGWRFDLATGACRTARTVRLQSFRAWIEDGGVVVEVPDDG